MCEGLRERYPEDISPDEMMAKYFPSAIPITPPNTACTGQEPSGDLNNESTGGSCQ